MRVHTHNRQQTAKVKKGTSTATATPTSPLWRFLLVLFYPCCWFYHAQSQANCLRCQLLSNRYSHNKGPAATVNMSLYSKRSHGDVVSGTGWLAMWTQLPCVGFKHYSQSSAHIVAETGGPASHSNTHKQQHICVHTHTRLLNAHKHNAESGFICNCWQSTWSKSDQVRLIT